MASKPPEDWGEDNDGHQRFAPLRMWNDPTSTRTTSLIKTYASSWTRACCWTIRCALPTAGSPAPMSGRTEALLPDFRANILDYVARAGGFHHAAAAGGRRSRCDLPPDHFAPHFVDGQSNLRLSHYPPVPAETNQFGIAPHSRRQFHDVSAAVRGARACRCVCRDGDWLDVPFIPGSFAVNAGDTLTALANGDVPGTGCHHQDRRDRPL